MDGRFYVDTRPPYISATFPTVTLTGSHKAIIPAYAYPKLGPNYFNWVGKAVRMTIFGIINTSATPGNINFSLLFGNGADANGQQLNNNMTASGMTSLTNAGFFIQYLLRCRAVGTAGSPGQLIQTGLHFVAGWGFQTIPPGGNAPATTNVDLSQDGIPSFQMWRSGSLTETVTVHEFIFEALN